MSTEPLGTVEQEAAACRAAWAAVPDAPAGLHLHHDLPVEWLSAPIEERIAYILRYKPIGERALRLRLMRPITEEQWRTYREARVAAAKAYCEAVTTAGKAYEKAKAAAHAAICVPRLPVGRREHLRR